MWRRYRAQEERGVALVEFALVAPLLLVLLFAILDFGRTFNYWIDATHLANEGARWAVVNKNPASSGTLQNYIQQQADTDELRNGGSSAVPAPLDVYICYPDGTGQVGHPVRVLASVEYNWLPFLSTQALGGLTSTTVSASSTMRLEANPTNYTADGPCPT
jgi:Flp pilus assembly protein TadG